MGFNFMRYKSSRYQILCVELYWLRELCEDRVSLRLNDNFIIQSIPVGDDSLNRAWWFIMGVITQSFSPKSTTWLPTQRTDTHEHGQTPKDKERTRYCHSEGNTHRRCRQTSRQDTHTETEQPQMVRNSQRDRKTDMWLQMCKQKQKKNANTKREWGGDWGMRHTSLMPANSKTNFLVLISKGDGEMRSWLWELISIKIENEIRGD